MKSNRNKHFAIATLLVAAAGIFAPRAEATGSSSSSNAVVIEWNQLAQTLIAGAPFSQNRQYAMLHVAVADAVVAIEGRYEPFRFDIRAPHGASARAAAAQAAHDILLHLYPASATTLASELTADLASIPPGPRWLGVQVGKKAAAWVIGWRQNDGFADANPNPPTFPTIENSMLPGIWVQTTPGAPGVAQFSRLGDVEPFGVVSPTQFLPDPQPELESAEYAADFNEAKNEGGKLSDGSYTAHHAVALLWAGGAGTPYANPTNPFRIWYNVARDVAQADGLSLVKTARLFALIAVSIHDSVQTSHTSKFVYRLWRPVTAVARAATDDNPATNSTVTALQVAPWTPVLGTPPYPSHASNMACIGAGAARMLRNVLGGERAISATWATSPTPTTKGYPSFWALALEEGDSRVWGGIHFRFELTDSQESCSAVADYIFETKMQQSTRYFR